MASSPFPSSPDSPTWNDMVQTYLKGLKDVVPARLHTPRLDLELFDFSKEHYAVWIRANITPAAMASQRVLSASPSGATATRKTSPSKTNDSVWSIHYVFRLNEAEAANHAIPLDIPLIGGVGIVGRKDGLPPELSWYVVEGFHSRGYAAEAAKELKRLAAQEFGYEELIAWTGFENEPSRRVARKLRLVPGPTARDSQGREHVVFVTPGTKIDESLILSVNTGHDPMDQETYLEKHPARGLRAPYDC